jgi:hypothetical protein
MFPKLLVAIACVILLIGLSATTLQSEIRERFAGKLSELKDHVKH